MDPDIVKDHTRQSGSRREERKVVPGGLDGIQDLAGLTHALQAQINFADEQEAVRIHPVDSIGVSGIGQLDWFPTGCAQPGVLQTSIIAQVQKETLRIRSPAQEIQIEVLDARETAIGHILPIDVHHMDINRVILVIEVDHLVAIRRQIGTIWGDVRDQLERIGRDRYTPDGGLWFCG